MGGEMTCLGAEQQPAEPAEPSCADHHQRRGAGLLLQYRQRFPGGHRVVDHQSRGHLPCPFHAVPDRSRGPLPQLLLARAQRQMQGGAAVRVDHPQPHPAETRLVRRGLHRGESRLRAVHAGHHRVAHGASCVRRRAASSLAPFGLPFTGPDGPVAGSYGPRGDDTRPPP